MWRWSMRRPKPTFPNAQLIYGFPGSGKSSLARRVDCLLIDTDVIVPAVQAREVDLDKAKIAAVIEYLDLHREKKICVVTNLHWDDDALALFAERRAYIPEGADDAYNRLKERGDAGHVLEKVPKWHESSMKWVTERHDLFDEIVFLKPGKYIGDYWR